MLPFLFRTRAGVKARRPSGWIASVIQPVQEELDQFRWLRRRNGRKSRRKMTNKGRTRSSRTSAVWWKRIRALRSNLRTDVISMGGDTLSFVSRTTVSSSPCESQAIPCVAQSPTREICGTFWKNMNGAGENTWIPRRTNLKLPGLRLSIHIHFGC